MLVGALAAFGVSVALTLAAERLAPRLGVVARPVVDRWHRATVPLLGGVAIVAGTMVGLVTAAPAEPRLVVLAAGAALMAAVGLLDDVRPVKPQTKLIAQIVLAGALLFFGFELRLTGYRLADTLLTLLWVVGLTNAFNLLDNMDGLAATIALVAAAFRWMFFLLEGDPTGALACAAFAGGVGGFLVRNFPPAKIFMGDAGSLFLGFFLAGLSIGAPAAAYSRGLVGALVVPVLLFLIPIFDTAFVTLTRLLAGRSPAVGGRDHTSHRLVAVGLSEPRAVLVLSFLSAAAGAVAFLSYEAGLSYTVALLALGVIGMVLLALHLAGVHVVEGAEDRRGGAVLALLANFPYKRQVATVLVDTALIPIAYYAAYVIRFEQDLPAHLNRFAASVPVVLVVQLGAQTAFGLYRGVWRFTSLTDLCRIAQAVALGTMASVVVLLYDGRFAGYSRTVFVLHAVLLAVLIGATRISFRFFGQVLRTEPAEFSRVLIYGAGAGGELLVRELRSNPDLRRTPVGFVDDDRSKHATRIHGVPVLGGGEELERVVRDYRVGEVIVSSAKVGGGALEAAREVCARQGIPLRRAVLRLEAA
jgi:UDP-GlcNAc:undecaprenyl-phosphate GlcNAc-1-phosphate transferase